MTVLSLLLLVIAFAIAFAIINWLVTDPKLRNIFYAVLGFIALVLVFQAMGTFGGCQTIRIR